MLYINSYYRANTYGLAGADQSQSAFESEVSGANNVSGATSENVLGGLAGNNGVCALRNETVNVNTEIAGKK